MHDVVGEVRHDNVRGTFGACFLCNTGRLKLKGAKLKNDCTVLRERRGERGKECETEKRERVKDRLNCD